MKIAKIGDNGKPEFLKIIQRNSIRGIFDFQKGDFKYTPPNSEIIYSGVPRIEQIINNTVKIKTPIIHAELDVTNDREFAQEVVSQGLFKPNVNY